MILELARNSCVFYEWVEKCETGKAWDLLCKKCSLKSTLCCLTPLFICLFVFFIFISSYQVKLGYLDLVSVDCRKFCALFFCLFVAFFFFLLLFLREHFFFSQMSFGFFSKISHFGIYLLGFLKLFSSPFLLLFLLWFTFEVTAFSSKFSFLKGEPAQFRFHSSEFSVSIMHSSLLS